jgi:hypothetical protein
MSRFSRCLRRIARLRAAATDAIVGPEDIAKAIQEYERTGTFPPDTPSRAHEMATNVVEFMRQTGELMTVEPSLEPTPEPVTDVTSSPMEHKRTNV